MKLIFIYPGLLTNKISVIGLPQTPQNFMRPLHRSKVTVWCAISSFGIISPYFFEDERERAVNVTGPRYIHMLENFLGPKLARHPVTEETFFQQDGATSHTEWDSIAAVRNFLTVWLTYLAQSVCIKPNFQGLTWFEYDGLGNDELITLFLVYW